MPSTKPHIFARWRPSACNKATYEGSSVSRSSAGISRIRDCCKFLYFQTMLYIKTWNSVESHFKMFQLLSTLMSDNSLEIEQFCVTSFQNALLLPAASWVCTKEHSRWQTLYTAVEPTINLTHSYFCRGVILWPCSSFCQLDIWKS